MRNVFSGYFLAVALTGTAIVPAIAEPRDPSELSGFSDAIRSASEARRGELPPSPFVEGPLMEGRNATVSQPSATINVEPYIARTIERSQRGGSN